MVGDIIHAGIVYVDGYPRFKDVNTIDMFTKAEFQLSCTNTYTDNDFEIQLTRSDFERYEIELYDWVYINGTEWGGRIEVIDHSDEDVVKISGPNYKYFIGRDVIYPPYSGSSRSDYLTLTDIEANAFLKQIRSNTVVSSAIQFYAVSDDDTGVKLSGSFRYCYLNDGIIPILKAAGLRLKIVHDDTADTPLTVSCEKVTDISDIINNDYDIQITSKTDSLNNINFMVGLGQGDLSARQVVFMKRASDGTISEVDVSTASLVLDDVSNQYIYDYPSVESLDELKTSMIAKFSELNRSDTIEANAINFDRFDYDIGDIIKGADTVTGIDIDSYIMKKVLTIDSSGENITYKVGDY